MSLTRAEVVAYLERLSTTELAALIDELQQRVGLRPLAVAPPPPVVFMGAPIGLDDEKTDFKVVLHSYGPDKKAVILALRELVSIGLKDAKDLIEKAPVVLREDASRDEAQAWAERLRRAGAHVDVR